MLPGFLTFLAPVFFVPAAFFGDPVAAVFLTFLTPVFFGFFTPEAFGFLVFFLEAFFSPIRNEPEAPTPFTCLRDPEVTPRFKAWRI